MWQRNFFGNFISYVADEWKTIEILTNVLDDKKYLFTVINLKTIPSRGYT